jgi:hypothetical protein
MIMSLLVALPFSPPWYSGCVSPAAMRRVSLLLHLLASVGGSSLIRGYRRDIVGDVSLIWGLRNLGFAW